MAKQKNYHYVIFKGYIHKIPIKMKSEYGGISPNKKDKQKKKKKRFKII